MSMTEKKTVQTVPMKMIPLTTLRRRCGCATMAKKSLKIMSMTETKTVPMDPMSMITITQMTEITITIMMILIMHLICLCVTMVKKYQSPG